MQKKIELLVNDIKEIDKKCNNGKIKQFIQRICGDKNQKKIMITSSLNLNGDIIFTLITFEDIEKVINESREFLQNNLEILKNSKKEFLEFISNKSPNPESPLVLTTVLKGVSVSSIPLSISD